MFIKEVPTLQFFQNLRDIPFKLVLFFLPSYWHRLDSTNSDLFADAFACSNTMHRKGIYAWFTCVCNMTKLLDISVTTDMLSNMNSNSFKKLIKNTLLNRYKEFWAHFRANNIDGKLKTYSQTCLKQPPMGSLKCGC